MGFDPTYMVSGVRGGGRRRPVLDRLLAWPALAVGLVLGLFGWDPR